MPNGHPDSIRDWARALDPQLLSVWRDALAQERQLSSDVWHGVMFFVAINGGLLAGIITLVRAGERDIVTGVLILLLSLLGFVIVLLAMGLLDRQRDYYLEMLFKKAVIDRALGLYGDATAQRDLVFPWGLRLEDLANAEEDFTKWQRERRYGRGTITRLLRSVYNLSAVSYVLAALLTIWGILCGGVFR